VTDYRPGVCNIGEAARRRRYGLGAVGMLATLGLVVATLASGGPRWLLVATAVPLFGAALGCVQGRLGFCVGFGLRGRYDVSRDASDRRTVEDDDARAADLRQVRRIVAYSVATAGAGTAVVYGVGLLAI
jgi:hypothetical protein